MSKPAPVTWEFDYCSIRLREGKYHARIMYKASSGNESMSSEVEKAFKTFIDATIWVTNELAEGNGDE